MIEKLDDDFILAELGITPVWLQKNAIEKNEKAFLLLKLNFLKAKIIIFAEYNEDNAQEKKLFRNIAEYLNSLIDDAGKCESFSLEQIKNFIQQETPQYIFSFGGRFELGEIANAGSHNSAISLNDMIKDGETKKIFWHDVRSFLMEIKENN